MASFINSSCICINAKQCITPAGIAYYQRGSVFVVSPDENKEVAGTVWELTAQERDLIRDFELIDLGWYKDSRGKAQTSDGKELDVEVAALREEQKVSREVDGIHHEVWFNCKPEDFMRVAEKAQREFLEKNKS